MDENITLDMFSEEKFLKVIANAWDVRDGTYEEQERTMQELNDMQSVLEEMEIITNRELKKQDQEEKRERAERREQERKEKEEAREEHNKNRKKKASKKSSTPLSTNKLWYFIKYYHLLLYIILFIICFYVGKLTKEYVIGITKDIDTSKYTVLINLIPIGCIVLFGVIAFIGIRTRYYHKVTGRKLGEDKGKYKRSYGELLEYFRDNIKTEMNTEELPLVNWKNAEGVILGISKDNKLLNIESGKDGRNYMIFGLPGSGKTAGPIITSALRFGMKKPLEKGFKESEGSVFCLDIKNDIYNATHEYRKIKRFNLMDENDSCCFNPFDGIDRMSLDDRCNFIENIGFNIIPETSDGENRYFTDTAYDFWNGIALQSLHENINASLPDIIDKILKGNATGWIDYVVDNGCDEAQRRLNNKKGENEKNLSGGYSLLCQNLRKFASDRLRKLLSNDESNEFISPQMLEDGYDVYVSVDQSELGNYAPLISMIVQAFFTGFIKRERNPNAGRLANGTLRPILMVLDEFAQLRTLKYESVASAFMTLRSKNVSIVCALQSRSSLVEVYKTENACSALIDCVTTFSFLSIQEVSTREWASKLIGKRKVLKISNSLNSGGGKGGKSSGKNVNEAEEPIFSPEEFGNLIDRERGRDEVIIYSQGKYIKANKQYYFK